MWTRKELKQKARDALKKNYWRIVLVTFLAVVLGSGTSSAATSAGSSSASAGIQNTNENIEAEGGAELDDHENTHESENSASVRVLEVGGRDALYESPQKMSDAQIATVIISLVVVIALFMMVLVYAFILFLYNPFYAGVCRFMLKSVDDRADVKEVASGFDHSYKNIVKTLFHSDIRIFLWTFLFIIPGIYKKYQYRMVPYILAEHSDINYREALQLSSDIMNGEKWHAFVLDLSFILWHMLGMVTCGIIELLFVNPYVYLTNAALYRRLSERWVDNGI